MELVANQISNITKRTNEVYRPENKFLKNESYEIIDQIISDIPELLELKYFQTNEILKLRDKLKSKRKPEDICNILDEFFRDIDKEVTGILNSIDENSKFKMVIKKNEKYVGNPNFFMIKEHESNSKLTHMIQNLTNDTAFKVQKEDIDTYISNGYEYIISTEFDNIKELLQYNDHNYSDEKYNESYKKHSNKFIKSFLIWISLCSNGNGKKNYCCILPHSLISQYNNAISLFINTDSNEDNFYKRLQKGQKLAFKKHISYPNGHTITEEDTRQIKGNSRIVEGELYDIFTYMIFENSLPFSAYFLDKSNTMGKLKEIELIKQKTNNKCRMATEQISSIFIELINEFIDIPYIKNKPLSYFDTDKVEKLGLDLQRLVLETKENKFNDTDIDNICKLLDEFFKDIDRDVQEILESIHSNKLNKFLLYIKGEDGNFYTNPDFFMLNKYTNNSAPLIKKLESKTENCFIINANYTCQLSNYQRLLKAQGLNGLNEIEAQNENKTFIESLLMWISLCAHDKNYGRNHSILPQEMCDNQKGKGFGYLMFFFIPQKPLSGKFSSKKRLETAGEDHKKSVFDQFLFNFRLSTFLAYKTGCSVSNELSFKVDPKIFGDKLDEYTKEYTKEYINNNTKDNGNTKKRILIIVLLSITILLIIFVLVNNSRKKKSKK